MASQVVQIRGSYVVSVRPYASPPQLSALLDDPSLSLEDGDVACIIDCADPAAPAVVVQGVYSRPNPVLTAITAPVGA